MKKILEIFVVVILFLGSVLIFWAGLAPTSFFNFFSKYPEISETVNQIGISNNQVGELTEATTSEPVLGTSGRILVRNNTWNVEIAETDATRTNGLSNRQILYPQNGMLFIFAKSDYQSFWMKDMLIPLDMIFFDNKWKIVEIDSDLQASSFPKIYGHDVLSQYVLEINAGEAAVYGLKVGDQAIFQNK